MLEEGAATLSLLDELDESLDELAESLVEPLDLSEPLLSPFAGEGLALP